MSLKPGARLGPYEIVAPLGAGGMGEVYVARDSRLGRDVALKVLSSAAAADAVSCARFDREARAISQLTHPNICRLYDVGEERVPDLELADGRSVRFLVMELLDGETLAARLAGGAMSVATALKVAIEMASALAAAHDAGIVHRDLKPGNVMLTKSGAKLLDFGLAKQSAAPFVSGLTMAPTTPAAAMTAHGTILGTLQYMAPEQLEGAEADARTDIFAFGSVLYEMLTGIKAFRGTSHATVISSIMSATPPDVVTLAPQTPATLDRVIRTCLAKSAADRLQSAHDLRMQLQWIVEFGDERPAGPVQATASPRRPEWVAWSIACVMTVVALAALLVSLRRPRELTPAPVQFSLPLPENTAFGGTAPRLAVSPDGRHVAVLASSLGFGGGGILVRSLAAAEFKPLPGTELATYPFWSADGRYIAFYAGAKLKKVAATGGPVAVVCDVTGTNLGLAWSPSNVIVVGAGPGQGGLQRVPAAGGAAAPFTTPDASLGETDHRWPALLPDGRHVLFLAVGKRGTTLKIASLDSADVTTLGPVESSVGYASGYLLSMRGGSLMAQPFDAASRTLHGEPVAIAEDVGVDQGRFTSFSASTSGVLSYGQRSGGARSRLTWLDRSGRRVGALGDADEYVSFRLSPDSSRVVVTLTTANNRDIWTIDTARWVKTRLTFDPGVDVNPIWSPDSTRVAFTSNAQGTGLYVKDANGSDAPRMLLAMDGVGGAMDWSRDGRFILYWNVAARTGGDLWVVPADGKPATAFLKTPSMEQDGRFSPDMRWIAYASDESGRMEVYAQPFPPTGARIRLSKDGGEAPEWRNDGKELYFVSQDAAMMAVPIEATHDLVPGVPQMLFRIGGLAVNGRHIYSATPDGQRFLVSLTERPGSLTVLLNWPALLPR